MIRRSKCRHAKFHTFHFKNLYIRFCFLIKKTTLDGWTQEVSTFSLQPGLQYYLDSPEVSVYFVLNFHLFKWMTI